MDEKFISRRDFLKMMTGLGVSLSSLAVLGSAEQLGKLLEQEQALDLAAVEPARALASTTQTAHRWGMVINLKTCIGCDYCVYACQAVNNVPDAKRWNIHLVDRTETGQLFHITRPCLHCQDAPCTAVCPVGATYVRDDGIVIMDYDRCIGCRYCQVACPYGARTFNWGDDGDGGAYQPTWGSAEVETRPRGVAEKCTFCVHRIDRGLAQGLMPGIDRQATPACVNICPVGARMFGDLNDPHSPVSQAIASNPTFRLREDLGTEPNVYYIPPEGMTL